MCEVFFIKEANESKEEFDGEMIVKFEPDEYQDCNPSYEDGLKLEPDSENDVLMEDDTSSNVAFENHLANVEKRKQTGKTG